MARTEGIPGWHADVHKAFDKLREEVIKEDAGAQGVIAEIDESIGVTDVNQEIRAKLVPGRARHDDILTRIDSVAPPLKKAG